MYQLLVTKANSDQVQAYLDWGEQLMGPRKAEAMESLKKEGISREAAFLVEIEGEPFLVHITEADNTPSSADMSMPVNKTHREKNQAVLQSGKRYPSTLVYDIDLADKK